MTDRPTIADDELLVFVGHGRDAADEAAAIKGLQAAMQDKLRSKTELIDDPPLRTVRVWKWSDDATARPGGQRNIDPFVEQAHFGVFVFKHRVGRITRQELDRCCTRPDRPPVAAAFTASPPDPTSLMDEEVIDAWRDVVRTKKELQSGWGDPGSTAVRPLDDFTDVDHLISIVLEQFERDLGGILARLRQAEDHGGPSSPPMESDEPPSLEDELERYRDRLEAAHRDIELAGFGERFRAPIRLEELYVPLHAQVDRRIGGKARFADAEEAIRAVGESEGRIALTDAFKEAGGLGERRGVVVLGDPGSGKTTLLKWLLLWTLRGDPESIGLPADIVPVFLPLRELTDGAAGVDDFLAEQLERNRIVTNPGFGKRLLTRDHVLFLFDGLDEVPDEATRACVSGWIDRLLEDHPSSRIAVTCRYAGYKKESRLPGRFLELHLRPLDTEQAERFIHTWYEIVETTVAGDDERLRDVARGHAKDRARELIDRLAQPGFRARRVYELTRNPLLLTTICLIHRDRGRLPHRRVELYKDAVSVLLERWRDRLGKRVGPDEVVPILQPIAHWLHEDGRRTRAPKEEVLPVLAASLSAGPLREQEPGEFLDSVRDHSGLLTGWGDDTFGFMHLGFQEYLAAKHIRTLYVEDKSVLVDLAARAADSWWQEVILLLLGISDPPLFEPFMSAFLRGPAAREAPTFISLCFDDSVAKSASPFVGWLHENADAPVDEVALAAWNLLEKHFPKDAGRLRDEIPHHPAIAHVATSASASAETHVHEESGYELVLIPAGTFMMGSPEDEEGRDGDEGPRHEVTLGSFLLGRHPVTNEQYQRFMDANPSVKPPEHWSDRQYNQPDQPVVGVSWDEAKAFCDWADLVLPTEAQWEYACRAGTTTRYWSGDSVEGLKNVGWFGGNSESRLHAVGEKPANRFGLLDMHGNVYEWCQDGWADDYEDPHRPGDGLREIAGASIRVFRGGGWDLSADFCRSASRDRWHPGGRDKVLGFRPARASRPASS